jgi:hypothetical protein
MRGARESLPIVGENGGPPNLARVALGRAILSASLLPQRGLDPDLFAARNHGAGVCRRDVLAVGSGDASYTRPLSGFGLGVRRGTYGWKPPSPSPIAPSATSPHEGGISAICGGERTGRLMSRRSRAGAALVGWNLLVRWRLIPIRFRPRTRQGW